MMRAFIICGTDTGIGKTIVASMLTVALDAHYWKPIQSGIEDGTDTQRVQALTGLSNDRFLPERYILSRPLSPHLAAELDGVEISELFLPKMDITLIIEGVGGLMVPITRRKLQIDIFKEWAIPVILCASTGLGTINHTLLSIEALHKRKIVLRGVIFIGHDNPDTIQTIADFSSAPVLGHVPYLDVIEYATLLEVFAKRFLKEDFA